MTLAEKLRFLADRAEDSKEFYIGDQQEPKKFINGGLCGAGRYTGEWSSQGWRLLTILSEDLHLNKQKVWAFTEEEKTILRNIDDRWKWIARDENGDLGLYNTKPGKEMLIWGTYNDDYNDFDCFNHLFQLIQWEDEEPCEFRRYL